MHIALYRKYRPATFDDVVGQEHIVTTLRHEVLTGTPAHAYLFTGSRGTGKTWPRPSTAAIRWTVTPAANATFAAVSTRGRCWM